MHFEAPSANLVEKEMECFLDWLNKTTDMDLIVKAAIAHLWFITIHPFEDGNGRIGRAITDMILARSEGSSRRLYSLSLNSRQKKILNLLLDGFKGKLTTSKWAKITKCSQDTAYRDVLSLIDLGILQKNKEGGRSTSYALVTGQRPQAHALGFV